MSQVLFFHKSVTLASFKVPSGILLGPCRPASELPWARVLVGLFGQYQHLLEVVDPVGVEDVVVVVPPAERVRLEGGGGAWDHERKGKERLKERKKKKPGSVTQQAISRISCFFKYLSSSSLFSLYYYALFYYVNNYYLFICISISPVLPDLALHCKKMFLF